MNPPSRLVFLVAVVVLAALAGCYTGSAVDANRAPDSPVDQTDGTVPAARSDAGTKPPAKALKGLPCDVAAILASECAECHGGGGRRSRLVTYDDLVAKSEDDASKTIAAIVVERMKASSRPMPPSGNLDSSKIAIVERWVKAGMPKGSCVDGAPTDGTPGTTPRPSPTGAPGPAPTSYPDPEPQPEPQPQPDAGTQPTSVCTSGEMEPAGDPSPRMKPGKACIACHTQSRGPAFTIAGTVYPTLREPNDCRGASDVKVLIVDADENLHAMTTNASGNFMTNEPIAPPFRALVIRDLKIREMQGARTSGDCNGCHSEAGNNSAPGRIMAP